MRRRCSLAVWPEPIQAPRATGNIRARTAVAVKVFELQPSHLRYQPKAKVRLTAHAANKATLIQSIRNASGRGGRSGLMNRSTKGIATRANGTFIQKIQRHESASFTRAVKSGVVGRVAYAITP